MTTESRVSRLITAYHPRNITRSEIKYAFALIMALYGLYYTLEFPYESGLYGAIHLGFAMVLYGLISAERTDSNVVRVLDYLFIVAITMTTIYMWANFTEMQVTRSVLGYTRLDYVFALVIIISVIEYTRREFGNILFGVIVVMGMYAYFGDLFPGIISHSGMSVERMVEMSVLNFTGAYGSLTVTAAVWIYIFILWAGLIEEFGDIDTFIRLAVALSSKIKSGVYQMTVLTSMFVGAIMGTPAGNIAITGSFTIPFMKDRGISPKRAAAIESVASTGGSVLPPIMGAAAFIMATLLTIPYSDVIIYGTVPALLLYLSIGMTVHFVVIRDRQIRNSENADQSNDESTDPLANTQNADSLEGNPTGDQATERDPFDSNTADLESDHDDQMTTALLKAFIPVALSVVVLVYTLAVLRYGPTLAGLYTITSYLGTKIFLVVAVDRMPISEIVVNTSGGLVRGSEVMAPLTIILASMGMVVAFLSGSGLPITLATEAGQLVAGSPMFVVLLMVMVVVVLFGLGMPIPAAYLLGVTLMAPLLIDFGVEPITAHFFVLYFAMVSSISPPVALGCAVASNIAGAGFLETVYETIRMAPPYFLLPFAFVYHPELLGFHGLTTLLTAVVVLVGLVMITAGTQTLTKYRTANGGLIVLGMVLIFSLGAVV